MHNPWAAFGTLTDWKLKWAHLPDGTMGLTCFRSKTVTLAEGLSQAERRTCIEHERHHVLRGGFPEGARLREELLIERSVGRILIPRIKDAADALAAAHGNYEVAADMLWVDELALDARLTSLAGRERQYLHDRMADVMIGAGPESSSGPRFSRRH